MINRYGMWDHHRCGGTGSGYSPKTRRCDRRCMTAAEGDAVFRTLVRTPFGSDASGA
jgi:hypothetical protein